MSEPILKIEDLQVNYGGIEAVNPGTVDANGVFAVADGHAAAVVCGTDARYAEEIGEALKERGYELRMG